MSVALCTIVCIGAHSRAQVTEGCAHSTQCMPLPAVQHASRPAGTCSRDAKIHQRVKLQLPARRAYAALHEGTQHVRAVQHIRMVKALEVPPGGGSLAVSHRTDLVVVA